MFSGLQFCGAVWVCPVCSRRIAESRRGELCELLSLARAQGLAPLMLTLTFRHKFGDDLPVMLDGLKRAWDRFRQRREWRAFAHPVVGPPVLAGHVTALEVTHGANGWHPHQHTLVLMAGDAARAQRRLAALLPVWLTCLRAFGLDGNDAALQVQDASAAGAYFGKWGAAEELTLEGAKRGRADSRTPWQLLDDARDGDAKAARLWAEFADAFKGRRQLVWSQGLRARFGIGEVSDEEAAATEAAEPLPVVREWPAVGPEWRMARRRRVALLEAARAGVALDAVEFGITDAERWRRDGVSMVIE